MQRFLNQYILSFKTLTPTSLPQVELPPEQERSPSPPPVYDRNGIRQNTREIRIRETQTNRKEDLIEELIKRDPRYRPPADYRPRKRSKKIFIPEKQYPVCWEGGGLLAGFCRVEVCRIISKVLNYRNEGINGPIGTIVYGDYQVPVLYQNEAKQNEASFDIHSVHIPRSSVRLM